MRLHGLALIFASVAGAAEMPTGYFHGTMLSWQGTPLVGVLSAKAQNGGGVFECHYDSKTYLEFEKHRVKADKFLEGDPLELLVHRRPGESMCYILSGEFVPPVKVVRPVNPQNLKAANMARATRPAVERHGTRRVSGVVSMVGDRSFAIHTREGDDQTFVFRIDTRFVGNGFRMERSDIKVNQRLEVEAGRNAEGEMEAFQLTWGTLSVHE